MHPADENADRATVLLARRPHQVADAPAPLEPTDMRSVHLTLPSGIVRDIGPCTLPPEELTLLRETVLPKVRRSSVILPAQPRYQLGASMAATGGWLFVLRTRHGERAVVARIGIGWRDHGASLVWQQCGDDRDQEPARPWVVDALDPAGSASLNSHEAARLTQWVPVLARDLAWAVLPPGTAGDSIPPPTRRYRAVAPRWIRRT